MNTDFQALPRRQFLGRASIGVGSAALASLLNPRLFAESASHFAPKAKRIIWLTQAGAPFDAGVDRAIRAQPLGTTLLLLALALFLAHLDFHCRAAA